MTEPRIALDRTAAAEALGIGTSTLDDWTASGFLPSIKRGKIRLYSVRALERVMEEASAFEEAGRGRKAASMGHGIGLQAPFGRKVDRQPPRRIRTPRAIRGDGEGREADAG